MTPTPDFTDLTPPHRLQMEWINNSPRMSIPEGSDLPTRIGTDWKAVFAQAARWGAQQGYQRGADERLEAFIHWLVAGPYGASIAANLCSLISDFRAAMRPAPPSLKQQALSLLDVEHGLNVEDLDLLRRALALIPEDAQCQ